MNEPTNPPTESAEHGHERVLRVTIQDSTDALGDESENIAHCGREHRCSDSTPILIG
jgi:hypothetical protein